MGYRDEKLWSILEKKVEIEDSKLPKDRQIKNKYLSAVEDVCDYGVDLAITIRDTFPMYTLHNEVHICNVLRLMADLLGARIDDLTRDEAAMLIMAACCHDIGMSYKDEDKRELLEDYDRINKYLNKNRREYVKAYAGGTDKPVMTDDMIQNYLRSIHHERVKELLNRENWQRVLSGKVNKKDLICVCQSHGMDTLILSELDQTPTIDLRLCAVLLRLADILDFDTTRAPRAVYEYSGFDKKIGDVARISKSEWEKHMSSDGFDFEHIPDRSHPYLLNYSASSKSMQTHQIINSYLDWVDQELSDCRKQMAKYTGRWRNLILPMKVERNIIPDGYVPVPYCLTFDHNRVMDLLVGRELYSDPAIFVRELLQNAIDAVRTRKEMDQYLPTNWKPQINIRTWMDDEGYHWFRIEDNGTGMSEEIIQDYLLKVGSSYYMSDLFDQDKIRCKVDPDYTPISRFGIGILSCFMGDEGANQVEISTKRFYDGLNEHSALRLNLHGMEGFYSMIKKEEGHNAGPMKGVTEKEKEPFLRQAGTAIAVRTNLYPTEKYKGFKEIVDKYVFFPEVYIHYDGDEGSFDYPTEAEFMEEIHKIQTSEKVITYDIAVPKKELKKIKKVIPEFPDSPLPKITIECVPIDYYVKTSYFTGAIIKVNSEKVENDFLLSFGDREVKASLSYFVYINDKRNELRMGINVQMDPEIYADMFILQNKYRVYFDKEYKDNFTKFYSIATDAEKNNRIIDMWTTKKEIESIIQKYEMCESSIDFALTDLMEYDWYKKYIYEIYNKTNMKEIVTHNGIFCGSADVFRSSNDTILAGVYLLKDRFQPNLDISRNVIRSIPLEVICTFSTVFYFNKINEHFYEMAEYPYYPARKYWSILDENRYLVDILSIYAPGTKYSVEMIYQKLEKKEHIVINPPALAFRLYNKTIQWARVYDFLCLSYLRKNFILKVEFKENYTIIIITKRGCDMTKEHASILPAYFFLPTMNHNTSYLTTKEMEDRCACNANHRFSKFILDNCELLNMYAKELLKQILHTILEDDYKEIIEKINHILTLLRIMPEGVFDITDDLYLTEEDFI